jgi:hypothetical protein
MLTEEEYEASCNICLGPPYAKKIIIRCELTGSSFHVHGVALWKVVDHNLRLSPIKNV